MSHLDKVLVVDDDKEIRNIVGIYLRNNGCEVTFAIDGQDAIDKIDDSYDLIILDIMMPVLDGISALPIIRENHTMPVIFLSAKGSDMDKIEGLMSGADDYMIKPFNPTELVVRAKANIRRYKVLGSKNTNEIINSSDLITIEHLVIDIESHEVKKNGTMIKLTKTEFEILSLLAKNLGRVFKSETILDFIFDDVSGAIGSNSIAVHIRNLRSKIEDDPKNPTIIKNIWGVGYKIEK